MPQGFSLEEALGAGASTVVSPEVQAARDAEAIAIIEAERQANLRAGRTDIAEANDREIARLQGKAQTVGFSLEDAIGSSRSANVPSAFSLEDAIGKQPKAEAKYAAPVDRGPGFMLRPEFVEEVRASFGDLPPEQRRAALEQAAAGTGVRAQAAQRILEQVKAEDERRMIDNIGREQMVKLLAGAEKKPTFGQIGGGAQVQFPDVAPTIAEEADRLRVPEEERIRRRLAQDEAQRAVSAADRSMEAVRQREEEGRGALEQIYKSFADVGIPQAEAGFTGLNVAAQQAQIAKTADRLKALEVAGKGESAEANGLRKTLEFYTKRQETYFKDLAEKQAQLSTAPIYKGVRELSGAKTFEEGFKAFAKDPINIVANLTAQSMPSMVPALILGVINPALGAAAMGGSSFGVEFGGDLMDFARDKGIDTSDPKQMAEFFANKELLREGVERAGTKAGIVGAGDMLLAGLASKTLVPKKITGPVAKNVTNVAAQMGAQAVGGGGFEALSQYAATGEIKPGEVLAEVFGELGGAPAEVAAQTAEARRQAKTAAEARAQAESGQKITAPSAAPAPDTERRVQEALRDLEETAGIKPEGEQVGTEAPEAVQAEAQREEEPAAAVTPEAEAAVKPAEEIAASAIQEEAKPALVEELPAEQTEIPQQAVVELPLANLKLSEDVPQFKAGADKAGIVEPLGGKFERTGVAPIQVWRRANGDMEVISGRHRFDLAKRSGETTIPAQIHDENRGFTRDMAAVLDAELNIRDGQGKVKDYVNYFKGTGLDQDTAESRGLLARAPGKRAFTIADKGSDELVTNLRADQIPDEAAYLIALNAPNDARLQGVGIKAVQEGKSAATAVNMMQAVRALAGEADTTTDMFGFDDSAMKEAEEMAKIAGRKQKEIQTRLNAITGAAKNPAVARAEGIDIRDPNAVAQRITQLRQMKSSWDNWSTNPDLIAEIRTERGVEPPVLKPYTVEEAVAKTEREEAARREEAAAPAEVPAPEEFVLTGSERAADEAAARGQMELGAPTEAEQAREALKESAANLFDVIAEATGARKNITGQQYTVKDIPPALTKVMKALVGLGYVNFKDVVRETMIRMRTSKDWAGLADKVTSAMLKKAYNNLPEFNGKDTANAVNAVSPSEMLTVMVAEPVAVQGPAQTGVKRQRDSWMVARDEVGRLSFGPGAKAYDAVARIANAVLDKVAMKPISNELGRSIRNMKAEVNKVQNQIVGVAKELEKLSPQEREMISDVIEGELRAGVHPPQHILNIAASMNDIMTRQSQELVRLGMLSPEAARRWENKYLPRFYMNKLRDDVTAWAKAAKRLMSRQPMMRGVKGDQLKARGIFETIYTDQLQEWIDAGWEQRDPNFRPNNEQTVVWRDYTREERENMGEIRDAMFRFVMGYNSSQRDVALGRLYENLADNYASPGPKEGYVQVPDTKVAGTMAPRYGKLAGLYVPKEIMDHLAHNDQSVAEGVLKLYRAGLSKWKEGKTVLNPVAHANNVLSNLTVAHFAGVSYWDGHKYAGAVKDIVTNDDMLKEAKDVGLFMGTFNQAELVESMPPQLRAMANMTESKIAKLGDRLWDTLTFTVSYGGKKYGARPIMQWMYENEDLFFRYLIYRDARKRGMEPEDAREYSQQFIFTYDDLPKGARLLRDAAMPFFSYTYKIVPVIARTALEYPWRFAAPATAVYAANAVMYAIASGLGGDEDDWWAKTLYKYATDEEFRKKVKEFEEEERKKLPPWMKGRTALGTQKAIRLGMDEVTGMPLFLDMSRIFPGGDLFDAQSNAGGVALLQPLTPSNPALTTLVAMLANKDMFFGKEVTKASDTDAEKAQKRAAWLWKQWVPAISVGNYHFDRGMNVLANVTQKPITIDAGPLGTVDYTGVGKDGLPVQPKYAAMQTMGIKVRPYDLEVSEAIERSKQNALIREIAIEISRINRLERKGAMSGEAADLMRTRLKEKQQLLREGLTVEGEEKK